MKPSPWIFKTKPIFSLDEFAKFEMTKQIMKQYALINSMLQANEGTLAERDIIVAPLPGSLITQRMDRPILITEVQHQIARTGTIVASAPYLLGLLKLYPQELRSRMESVIRIELLDFSNEYSFPNIFGKGRFQFCLKRVGESLVLDYSDYVVGANINANSGFASHAVRTIIFPPSPKDEFLDDDLEDEREESAFKDKMIG